MALSIIQEYPDTRCRKLRTKSMYIESEPDPSVPSMASGLFWCLHTHNCLGPDGKAVGVEDCAETRGCYEPL
jgi:hypothetical protein